MMHVVYVVVMVLMIKAAVVVSLALQAVMMPVVQI
jgi:hypothetical protein